MTYEYDVIATSDDGRFRARLFNDVDCDSPRTYDHSTVLYNYTRHYDTALRIEDGDLNSAVHHALCELAERVGDIEVIARFAWLATGHRAVSLFVDGDWLLLVESDERVAETAGASFAERDAYLDAVAGEYSTWAQGECYGVIIERAGGVGDDGECTDFTEVDACWGFIGDDYATQMAQEMLADAYQADAAPSWGQLTFASAV